MNRNLKIVAALTSPVAQKLYDFAISRTLPTQISIIDFQRLCGLTDSMEGWQQEVSRACVELVNAKAVRVADVTEDMIFLE